MKHMMKHMIKHNMKHNMKHMIKHMMKHKMKCKRIGVWIISVTAVLGLYACAGKGNGEDVNTPEKTMQYTMESLQELDLDEFNTYTDNYVQTHWNWFGFPIEKEYRVFNELLQPARMKGKRYEENKKLTQKIVEHMTWEITDVRQEEDQAEIDLQITNLDMTDVTGNFTINILENMVESEGTGLRQCIRDVSNAVYDKSGLLSILEELDEDDTCTIEVTVSAYRKDDKWKIHISDEFINAFMGNIMTENYSDEVERQIENLENEYERKIERSTLFLPENFL